jgi:NH3-dependent NAD+ synthetase
MVYRAEGSEASEKRLEENSLNLQDQISVCFAARKTHSTGLYKNEQSCKFKNTDSFEKAKHAPTDLTSQNSKARSRTVTGLLFAAERASPRGPSHPHRQLYRHARASENCQNRL